MKRSHAFAVASVTVAALTLTGCSGSGPDGPSSGDGSAACATDPKSGGTLVSARQNETLSLKPYNTPGGWGDGEAIDLIFEPLVLMDPTGATSDIVGGVADTWSVAEDGLSYDFHIRDGVTFSNGGPVTPEDVQYSLDTYANPDRSQFASFADGYESTEIVDGANVRVHLSEPKGGFLYSLAFISAVIVPKALVEEQGDAFWANPIGSGPYKLESWTKGSSITFVRNEKYWQTGTPLLDKVVFNFVTNDSTRLLNLKGGEAQLIDSVPWTEVAGLQRTNGIAVDAYEVPSWILLSLNHQKPQFADLNVRQALSTSIDREAINNAIYSGLGTVPNSVLPQQRYDADTNEIPAITFDVDAAKALLAESDYPNGFKATLEFPSSSPAFQSLAAVLQSQWAELGIEVELRPEDQATLSKSLTGGTYDLILPYALAVTDVPIPDEFAAFYAIPGGTNGFFTWWEDPDVEAMVREFITNPDETERAELWPQAQEALLEQTPAINVLDLPLVKARAANVCGNTVSPIGYDTLRTTWIAE